jgi:modulator of FtsH protease HflK
MTDEHNGHHHHNHEEAGPLVTDDLGAAGKSLAEALRISFAILKIIMIVVVVAFFGLGFQTIGPDEQGIKLRFGKVQVVDRDGGVALGPGLTWVFPYPIDELVKIPVQRKINLSINSFWWSQTTNEALGLGVRTRQVGPTLDPIEDGYALTRGELPTEGMDATGLLGNDYNIVHSKWQVTYKVDDIHMFFKNVYVKDPAPGEIYYELMEENIKPLLMSCVEDAVVSALVHYSIDEAIESKEQIPLHVERLVQQKLRDINSGLSVISVTLNQMLPPSQVAAAFNALTTAQTEASAKVSQAQTLAQSMVNETAGELAHTLLSALKDDTSSEAELEALWQQAAGQVQSVIAQARAYRTVTSESAKSDAEYFNEILPKFRKYPELVVKDLYLDTIATVLENMDEKFVLQDSVGQKDNELRILLNRDPKLKTKQTTQTNQAQDGSSYPGS